MGKKILFIVIVTLLCVNVPTIAQRYQHWWTGGTSSDVADSSNWTELNGYQGLPGSDSSGGVFDIVRIGAFWNNGDPGYGGYEDFILDVQPVLSTRYMSPDFDSHGGWWFVLNKNILTLKDGAFLVMNRDNCNLRNGGKLIVEGRSDTDGPSLVTAKQFRIAENGSDAQASADTCRLLIKGNGWVQADPSLRPDLVTYRAAAYMIGTADDPGTMPRGEIFIEDNGRLELKEGIMELYLTFSNADPSVNQIIIRDNGELWLQGDGSSAGNVAGTDVSIQDLIDQNLIINDQGGSIEVSGTSPAVVKATGVVGVEDKNTLPVDYALKQNYPNPFNPSTIIEYSVPNATHVRLKIFNVVGEEVATLVDKTVMQGTHRETWNASGLPSGVYYYRLQAGDFMQTKSLLLLK